MIQFIKCTFGRHAFKADESNQCKANYSLLGKDVWLRAVACCSRCGKPPTQEQSLRVLGFSWEQIKAAKAKGEVGNG